MEPPVGKPPVKFTHEAAERTRDAVEYVERMYRGGPPPRRQPRSGTVFLTKAKTGAGGIAAGSADGATPGSGLVTLASWSSGSWVVGTETVSALNPGSAAVGANKFVTLGWVAGMWEVVVEPC